VAWWTGNNLFGDVVEWDNIVPGMDGTFSADITQFYSTTPVTSHGTYTGTITPNSTSYGYAWDGWILREYDDCSGLTVSVVGGDKTVKQCEAVTLTASVVCAQPPITYMWYRFNDVDGAYPVTEGLVGVNTFTIPQVSSADAGLYFVMVSDGTPGSSGEAFS
jgi:hypothetical protein